MYNFVKNNTMQHFQTLGYFKEYYIGSKFIGFIESNKDREQIGFWGKKQEQPENDIIIQNKT